MDKLKKITFIGDLTVDRPLLKYSYLGNNKFNFDEVFDNVREKFKQTELVIGNLETTFGGSKDFFKTEYMLLNTPDEFINSLSNANINIVTTANNHILDQNIKGLNRTLDLLDENNISHTGTYRNIDEFNDILIKNIGKIKIALVAGTDGINQTNIDYKFSRKNHYYIDAMKSLEVKFQNGLSGFIKESISKYVPGKIIRKIRRIIARKKIKKSGTFFKEYVDKIKDGDFDNMYLNQWIDKIKKAKDLADYVFVLPHMGGQFNENPGSYSQEIMNKLLNLDVFVIGNHPHIIQKITKKNEIFGAYSIGSFNMSISGDYVIKNNLPQYSLGINFYFDENRLVKASYEYFKIIEEKNGRLQVYSLIDLYNSSDAEDKQMIERDIKILNNRIGLNNLEVQSEYFI